VGPFNTDSAGYVFGDQRPSPNVNHGGGIDVSPAVRDYLGLGFQAWLTGDLLRKRRCRLDPGSVLSLRTRGAKN
jgi:hypothetical protein